MGASKVCAQILVVLGGRMQKKRIAALLAGGREEHVCVLTDFFSKVWQVVMLLGMACRGIRVGLPRL